MSIKVASAVWERSRHKGSALLILLALADFAHDDGGGAYPSLHVLAQKSRLTERNVQLVLALLRDSGELQIAYNAGPGGRNLYTVVLDALGGEAGIAPEKFSPPEASIAPPPKRSSPPPPKPRSPQDPLVDPLDDPLAAAAPPPTGAPRASPAAVRGGAADPSSEVSASAVAAWAYIFREPPDQAERAGLARWARQEPAIRRLGERGWRTLLAAARDSLRPGFGGNRVAVVRARYQEGALDAPREARGHAQPQDAATGPADRYAGLRAYLAAPRSAP